MAPVGTLTAGHDMLPSENKRFAETLGAAGVPIERVHYPGQVHDSFHALALMPEAEDAADRAAKALAHTFAPVSTISCSLVAAEHGEIGVDGNG